MNECLSVTLDNPIVQLNKLIRWFHMHKIINRETLTKNRYKINRAELLNRKSDGTSENVQLQVMQERTIRMRTRNEDFDWEFYEFRKRMVKENFGSGLWTWRDAGLLVKLRDDITGNMAKELK